VGEQKQGKKSNKWVSKTYFAMHAHNGKKQEVCRDGNGGQRGSFGATGGEERGVRCDMNRYVQGGAKKNEQRRQAKRKRASANLLNPLICIEKTVNTKRTKTKIKKPKTSQNKKQAAK